MKNCRSKYRNPSPPPGHQILESPSSNIRIVKNSHQIIDGIPCEFLGIIMESGVLEDSYQHSEFDIMKDITSDEEVVVMSVVKKVAPLVNIEQELDIEPPLREPSVILSTEKAASHKHTSSSKEKRRIKIKTEKLSGYSSDDSIDPWRYSKKITHKRKSLKSRSSENESLHRHCDKKRLKKDPYYNSTVKQETKVKQETSVKQEQEAYCNIYRKYYCKTCKASMNSEGAYTNHMNGKRHLKAVKLEIIDKAEKYADPATFLNKYPPPPPNVYRVKMNETAESQRVIETHVKSPCPGLDKLIEIQGLDETRYYCELCESTCNSDSIIPHLTGFPHQLQCLKYFKPEIYESYSHREKREIKGKVIRILHRVEKERGCGKLKVEKEFVKDNLKEEFGAVDETSMKIEVVTNNRDLDDPFVESYAKTIIPDNSKSDFYCQMCDAHMNNKLVWESHIRGKRHIANCRKNPLEEPSKRKTVVDPNARALLLDELDHVTEPVVGLDHIRETRKPEVSGAMYNCFLCGACSGATEDMIDHILSQKHRTKYLENINHPDIILLKEMNMQEIRLASIIEETCGQVETSKGRGKIEVHVTKLSSTYRW